MTRKSGSRRQNTTILLLVEGYTEQIYFNQLRRFERLPITIKPEIPKKSSPREIIETALQRQKDNNEQYDHIWCIFDCDVLRNNQQDIKNLCQKAKIKKVYFAESVSCFEIWFLLHFVLPQKYYKNQNEVIDNLKQLEKMKDYHKNQAWQEKINVYERLKPHIATALENAGKLPVLDHKNIDVTSTNVHHLINLLFKIRALLEESP
ncbi:hypothetical protein Holit_00282 [Hollandina sp. SP2]